MLTLPCEQCPVYPMCRQREQINCDNLWSALAYELESHFPYQFPKLLYIGRSEEPFLPITRVKRIAK